MELNLLNRKKEIIATALISPEDYEKVIKIKWHLHIDKWKTQDGIIEKKYVNGALNNKHIRLHSFILGKAEKGFVIDHINGDGLDNRRENLRFITYAQNSQNKKKSKNKYYGIVYREDINKWQVSANKKYLGCYNNELDAAKAYDCHVLKLYGESAKTNGLVNINETNTITAYEKKAKTTEKYICYDKKTKKNRLRIIRDKKTVLLEFNDDINELVKIRDKFLIVYEKIKKEKHLKKEITYDDDGKAVIIIKNKFNEIYNIIVDEDKWHELSEYTWCMHTNGYVQANINSKLQRMHRYLLNDDLLEGDIVDHKNNNKIDNRLCNLEISNYSLNGQNKEHLNKEMKYKGVTKTKNGKRFQAKIKKDGKRYQIGTFDTEKEAAIAYNNKVFELYGPTGRINIIDI